MSGHNYQHELWKILDEEAAMRAAMEYERRRGRIPEDVSMREHYDILSRDPRTEEARYIEVKGRSGFDLEVELTEEEFKLARELVGGSRLGESVLRIRGGCYI
jgi:hypothetical protein